MEPLTLAEKHLLLHEAREAIEFTANQKLLPPLRIREYPMKLQEIGASFVTLTIDGQLRGCIGSLEARIPLIEDVREHAIHAAFEDYRFPPVKAEELKKISIEISRLTKPEPLTYEKPTDLPRLLHPGIDGVILKEGSRRATFLPQVWEQLPDPKQFLGHLCEKMGASKRLWELNILEVFIYHVEEFHE
jgi:AmmeMemoRadiSam system protein A